MKHNMVTYKAGTSTIGILIIHEKCYYTRIKTAFKNHKETWYIMNTISPLCVSLVISNPHEAMVVFTTCLEF